MNPPPGGVSRANLRVDWFLLAAALAAFSTGLVLLLGFHVGHGTTASAPFGPVDVARASPARHPWIDVHHLSSLLSLGLLVHHVGRRRRSLVRRRN